MLARILLILCALGAVAFSIVSPSQACCPAPMPGKPVVNADQEVIIIWDAATKTEHFIRRASFKSDGDDFGFLIPTPTRPELAESGNDAFPYLAHLTAPPRPATSGVYFPFGCACAPMSASLSHDVRVVEEKLVAGFNATVLEARSADGLVRWLKEHDYAFSAEVEAWAKPYVDAGWMITALKIAKAADAREKKTVAASSLRMSFHTDRPLFPYREPDSRISARALEAHDRLLRIFFIAEARYRGELTPEVAWTGRPMWSNKLSAEDRKKVLELLQLPPSTGPSRWWLTEFEDHWPYKLAPADLYFSRDHSQRTLKRTSYAAVETPGWPTDVWLYVIAMAVVLPPVIRRVRQL
jgi:hypothetical protein